MCCCIVRWLFGCCNCGGCNCGGCCCRRPLPPPPRPVPIIFTPVGSLNYVPSVPPATSTAALRSVHANLSTAAGTVLASGRTLVFDSVIADQNRYVYYDYTTGELVINKTGNFLANWWVGIQGSDAGNPCFSVFQNGGGIATSCLPSASGHLSGTAAISVAYAPARISLVNTSYSNVTLSSAGVQAGLVLTEAR